MFEEKLAKKFSLIVKKELNNLNHYDSRLLQEYLKKIQELETSYNKQEPKVKEEEPQLDTYHQ